MYQSYENLEVWSLAVDLPIKIYHVLKESRDYGFKDQICRVAVSIPSNIAEGMERNSIKDTTHFLNIAKQSSAEFRTQLIIAQKINYLNSETFCDLSAKALSVSRML